VSVDVAFVKLTVIDVRACVPPHHSPHFNFRMWDSSHVLSSGHYSRKFNTKTTLYQKLLPLQTRPKALLWCA